MALHFFTKTAKTLLADFDKRIAQDELKGKITTWEKAADGHYTHDSKEWRAKAWFKPAILADRLTFNIIKPKNNVITPFVYGYYHGHLIETFLNHFDTSFTSAAASALAEHDDIVS